MPKALPRNLGKHTPLFWITKKTMNPLLKALLLRINKTNFTETGEYKSINVGRPKNRSTTCLSYKQDNHTRDVLGWNPLHLIFYTPVSMSSRQLFPWTFLTFLTYHTQSILIALNVPEMQCATGYVHSLGKMLTTRHTILAASLHATAPFSHNDNSVY